MIFRICAQGYVFPKIKNFCRKQENILTQLVRKHTTYFRLLTFEDSYFKNVTRRKLRLILSLAELVEYKGCFESGPRQGFLSFSCLHSPGSTIYFRTIYILKNLFCFIETGLSLLNFVFCGFPVYPLWIYFLILWFL